MVKAFCAVVEGALPADSTNSDEFVDFITMLRHACGKAAPILDSAPYRKSAKVKKRPEELNGDIVPVFLPPYAPQLNPAEFQAVAFKKRPAGRRFYSNAELEQAVFDLVDAGGVTPVRLMDCLLPAKADALEDSWHRFLEEYAPRCARTVLLWRHSRNGCCARIRRTIARARISTPSANPSGLKIKLGERSA